MSRPSQRRWKTFALWCLPVLGVLLLGGIFTLRAIVESYLRSERFRTVLAQKAGATLHAEAEIAPLRFETSSLYAESFAAQGHPAAAFAELKLDGLRAEWSLRRIFDRVLQIDRAEIQRVAVRVDGTRSSVPEATPLASEVEKPHATSSGWLPNRVEIRSLLVRESQFDWAGGGLHGTAFDIAPADGGWALTGTGGKIEHGTLPPLEVQRLDLRYRAPSLFVNSAEFRQGANGRLNATGEINFNQRLDLRAELQQITLTPYLAGDWKTRLHGEVSGEITVRGPLPLREPPEISGSLTLANGQLEALPVLNQIAAFTQTQQFRKLALSKASADFTQRGGQLSVRQFVAESEGLLRVEGAFTIENRTIDGSFQVGVSPGSLQWLPGSQARVFTESRGGYLWAPMRLTGPADSPHEDLSARLLTAAGGALLESVEGGVKGGSKNLRDAAKSVLDLLLTPPK